jgi:hypothetical protein
MDETIVSELENLNIGVIFDELIKTNINDLSNNINKAYKNNPVDLNNIYLLENLKIINTNNFFTYEQQTGGTQTHIPIYNINYPAGTFYDEETVSYLKGIVNKEDGLKLWEYLKDNNDYYISIQNGELSLSTIPNNIDLLKYKFYTDDNSSNTEWILEKNINTDFANSQLYDLKNYNNFVNIMIMAKNYGSNFSVEKVIVDFYNNENIVQNIQYDITHTKPNLSPKPKHTIITSPLKHHILTTSPKHTVIPLISSPPKSNITPPVKPNVIPLIPQPVKPNVIPISKPNVIPLVPPPAKPNVIPLMPQPAKPNVISIPKPNVIPLVPPPVKPNVIPLIPQPTKSNVIPLIPQPTKPNVIPIPKPNVISLIPQPTKPNVIPLVPAKPNVIPLIPQPTKPNVIPLVPAEPNVIPLLPPNVPKISENIIPIPSENKPKNKIPSLQPMIKPNIIHTTTTISIFKPFNIPNFTFEEVFRPITNNILYIPTTITIIPKSTNNKEIFDDNNLIFPNNTIIKVKGLDYDCELITSEHARSRKSGIAPYKLDKLREIAKNHNISVKGTSKADYVRDLRAALCQ